MLHNTSFCKSRQLKVNLFTIADDIGSAIIRQIFRTQVIDRISNNKWKTWIYYINVWILTKCTQSNVAVSDIEIIKGNLVLNGLILDDLKILNNADAAQKLTGLVILKEHNWQNMYSANSPKALIL